MKLIFIVIIVTWFPSHSFACKPKPQAGNEQGQTQAGWQQNKEEPKKSLFGSNSNTNGGGGLFRSNGLFGSKGNNNANMVDVKHVGFKPHAAELKGVSFLSKLRESTPATINIPGTNQGSFHFEAGQNDQNSYQLPRPQLVGNADHDYFGPPLSQVQSPPGHNDNNGPVSFGPAPPLPPHNPYSGLGVRLFNGPAPHESQQNSPDGLRTFGSGPPAPPQQNSHTGESESFGPAPAPSQHNRQEGMLESFGPSPPEHQQNPHVSFRPRAPSPSFGQIYSQSDVLPSSHQKRNHNQGPKRPIPNTHSALQSYGPAPPVIFPALSAPAQNTRPFEQQLPFINNQLDDVNHYHQSFPNINNAPPGNHQFQFGVNNPHPGNDIHEAQYNNGLTTKGLYTIQEPNGSWRNVNYNADHTGFSANVESQTQHGYANSYSSGQFGNQIK